MLFSLTAVIGIEKVQKKCIAKHWGFAGLIFQANKALTERLLRELVLVLPVPD